MIISLCIIALLVSVVLTLTRLSGSRAEKECRFSDASFLDNFSLQAYRPMLRLAAQRDQQFIAGLHVPLSRYYRKLQRQMLREYLHEMSRDFNRLYSIATSRSVHASDDPENFSLGLIDQQMSFIFTVWGIEARLLLDRFFPYSVDLKPLVDYIESLACQTRQLVQPQLRYHVL